jgi:hypothetical protein
MSIIKNLSFLREILNYPNQFWKLLNVGLNLAGCRNITDAGLANLQYVGALQSLNLAGCRNIIDTGLAHLQHVRALQFLNLTGCSKITNAGLAILQHVCTLQSLINKLISNI